jgi:1-acyl-sn-glycerol-3-phosphate acyltransferase
MWDKVLYGSGRIAIGALSRLLLAMNVTYHTPLPTGPKIIAVNHPTTTDPFLITTVIPDRLHILVSDTLFKVPVFGRYLQAAGHIKVVRGNLSSYREAVRLLGLGESIAIFPEGNLSPLSGGCHAPRSGVARLALTTGAPVIPVGINLQPENIRFFEAHVAGGSEESRWYLHGAYAVTVGEPLFFNGDTRDRDLIDRVGDQIMRRIVKLSAESGRRISSEHPVICQSITETAEMCVIDGAKSWSAG